MPITYEQCEKILHNIFTYDFVINLSNNSFEKIYLLYSAIMFDKHILKEETFYKTISSSFIEDMKNYVIYYQDLSIDNMVQNKLTYSEETDLKTLWYDLIENRSSNFYYVLYAANNYETIKHKIDKFLGIVS